MSNKTLLILIQAIELLFHRITLFFIVVCLFYVMADGAYPDMDVNQWINFVSGSIFWLIFFNEFIFTPAVYAFVGHDKEKIRQMKLSLREEIKKEGE